MCTLRRCPGTRSGQECAVTSKARPNKLADALGAQLSNEAFADILAAWRKKNPKEAELDQRARAAAREARRVNIAEDACSEDDQEMDMIPGGAYGVAALHLPFQRYLHKQSPQDDDSASEDEHFAGTLSWSEPTPLLSPKQTVQECGAVHLAPKQEGQECGSVHLCLLYTSPSPRDRG